MRLQENSNAPIYRENSCVWVNFSIRLQFDARDLKHILRLAAMRTFTFIQNPIDFNTCAPANPLRPICAKHNDLVIVNGKLAQRTYAAVPRNVCPHLAVRFILSGFTAELAINTVLAIV